MSCMHSDIVEEAAAVVVVFAEHMLYVVWPALSSAVSQRETYSFLVVL